MSADAEKLRNEIERLEKELETQHFTALFDQKGYDHKLKRLKKLRKQLAELEGTREKQVPVVKPAEPVPAARKKPATQAAPKPAKKTAAKKAPARKAPKTSAKPAAKKPAKKTAKKTTQKTATKKTATKKTTRKKASGK